MEALPVQGRWNSTYVGFVCLLLCVHLTVLSRGIATLYIHRQSAYLVGRERKVSCVWCVLVCVHVCVLCLHISLLILCKLVFHFEKFGQNNYAYANKMEAWLAFWCYCFQCSCVNLWFQICDMPVDHPSCSKQHAVIQYRLVNYTKADGSTGRRVR